MRTYLTLAILLLTQPVPGLISAHVISATWRMDWLGLAVIALSGLAAAAALLTSGWTRETRTILAVLYAVYACASFPFVALLVGCSRDDCI
jgi:hypothetical protein